MISGFLLNAEANAPVSDSADSMYALIYTYTKGKWMVQPYIQYSDVPANNEIGIAKGASAIGGAFLISRSLGRGLSLAGRAEYISISGSPGGQEVNLLYGPGSAARSATLTPTFQRHDFFMRGDLSLVRANNATPGYAFGASGMKRTQYRAIMEAGLLF